MQHPSSYLGDSIDAPPPTESLFRHMRWLVPLALIGIALLALLLSYSTYSVATILVPDRGGVFREGVAGFPQYLSPIWCQTDDVDHDLCTLIYRGLTRVDKTGRVVPDLAETWQVIDNKTYIFSLKPEQFWHDGQEVTVDDVLFTVGVLQDPSLLDTPGLPGFWRSVSVEKLDDFTVKFTLPQPFAPFLDYTTIGLLPEHIYAEMPAKELVTSRLDETPIGAGPMRVAELGADYIRLEPSQFYRGSTPYITSLELHFFPDYPSVLAAFDAGATDGISRILPGDIGVAAERDDLQLFSSVESGYEDILLNLRNPNTPFFQDIRVRQALLTSIDREAMVEEALAGQGVVAHSLLTPKNWAYNPEVRQYDARSQHAARLLDEAGWIDTDGDRIRDRDGVPLSFVLLVKDDNLHMAVGERLRKDWEAVGVRAEVTPVTFSGLVTDFLAPAPSKRPSPIGIKLATLTPTRSGTAARSTTGGRTTPAGRTKRRTH